MECGVRRDDGDAEFRNESFGINRPPRWMPRLQGDPSGEPFSKHGEEFGCNISIELERWRQLNQQRAEVLSEFENWFEEALEVGRRDVPKTSFVRQDLRYLDGELKARGNSHPPASIRLRLVGAIERRIDLHAAEDGRVSLEVASIP